MNQISRLIAKLCPLGVGFQLLGNLEDSGVVKLGRGNVISKTDLASSPGDYPVYSSSAAGSGEFGRYGKFMFEDERITWSIDGGGRFFYRSPHNYSVTNVCGWLKVVDSSKISTRFLFHVLTGLWETKVFDYTKKAHPSVIREEYLIPLPPIEIQIEIVRILDAFTELTTELTAELTARKKQYNHYRDQLLSFEEGDVEWKTLGDEEFFEVTSGGTPSTGKPEYWDNGNIPWLKSESCNNEPVYSAKKFITELGLKKSSAKLLQKETTLIALVGATIFKTAFLEFPAATNQNIASIKSKNSEVISDKFVFYFLASLYEKLKSEMRNYGMLNLSTLRQFKIPVPSPEEQTRIVAILDKFDALTNSITEGLPREIELRQKQYAYYRDLLLSFPKPEAPTVAQA